MFAQKRAFILCEVCLAILVLSLYSLLLASWESHLIVQEKRAITHIKMLFLAQSLLNQMRMLKKKPAIKKEGYSIEWSVKPRLGVPSYNEVILTIAKDPEKKTFKTGMLL